MSKKVKVKIGEVGVDSGQLMICDPSYIDGQFLSPDSGSYDDHAHKIYRHKDDKSLWQFTYGNKPQGGVNKFPGRYDEVILKYGKSPNDLIKEGIFEKTDIDPTPHIPTGEFSYRGICKSTIQNLFGQLNYSRGHKGVAVAFRSGLGDGTYEVFAEITNHPEYGQRVTKVIIEMPI